MTNSIKSVNPEILHKLSGKISDYKCTRQAASFVFSDENREQLGVVAIAAALAGMGPQSASVAASASGVEEDADYVEFILNGAAVKGWVWRSPFKEGDNVDVAALWRSTHFEAFAIARPIDRTIALYPHCSRSRSRHIKNAVKWWAICNVGFFGILGLWLVYVGGLELLLSRESVFMSIPVMLFFVLMFSSLTRQFLPFVSVSEKIFIILDIPNPKNVDLVKSSRQQRTSEDPGEFGTFYFRY